MDDKLRVDERERDAIEEESEMGPPMTRAEALAEMQRLSEFSHTRGGDVESTHVAADCVLLRLLNDPEITRAFCRMRRWYS